MAIGDEERVKLVVCDYIIRHRGEVDGALLFSDVDALRVAEGTGEELTAVFTAFDQLRENWHPGT